MSDATRRILVIDDAATVRMYHRDLLEKAGFVVDEAMNGIEALEKVMRDPNFDLLLVDVNMPKLDGYGFLRELRNLDLPRQPPAIMITTESQSHDRTRAYQAGANFYMIKPSRPDTLLSACRVMLGLPGVSS